MNLLSEYRSIHIELTDKCQASCPMCARNHNGGQERPFVGQHEIFLEQFQQWFTVDDLKNIQHIYACGNYGDPIIARDCLEICRYIKESNKDIHLGIHTNGSARSITWWKELGQLLSNSSHEVVFGIDGYADSHVLYRKGTDWYKIIENAKAFMSVGGRASIDTLIFEHNEAEMDQFRSEMFALGFDKINLKTTSRFYEMTEFPVQDKDGKFEYNIRPPVTDKFKKTVLIKLEEVAANLNNWNNNVSKTRVLPKCIERKEIYIDSRGNVLPCCWVGSDYVEEHLEEKLTIHKLRNKMVQDTKNKFSQLSTINLNTTKPCSENWSNLQEIVTGQNKPWVCAKNCHE